MWVQGFITISFSGAVCIAAYVDVEKTMRARIDKVGMALLRRYHGVTTAVLRTATGLKDKYRSRPAAGFPLCKGSGRKLKEIKGIAALLLPGATIGLTL